jgi:hypothetical protein
MFQVRQIGFRRKGPRIFLRRRDHHHRDKKNHTTDPHLGLSYLRKGGQKKGISRRAAKPQSNAKKAKICFQFSLRYSAALRLRERLSYAGE